MRWRMASRIKPPNRAVSGGRRTRARIALLLSPPLFLIGVWMRVAFRLLTTSDIDTHSRSSPSSSHDPATVVVVVVHDAARAAGRPSTIDERPRVVVERKRRLISRDPGVIVTSSTRGNLGPPSVLNQDPPGEDWLGDRWQAASDMGGTAIPGRHWILVDFSSSSSSSSSSVFVSKIVLDWETAYAEDYRVEGRLDPPPRRPPPSGGKGGAPRHHGGSDDDGVDGGWCTLYDGVTPLDDVVKNDAAIDNRGAAVRRTTEEYGQSPGVKRKMPLHVVHTIDWTTTAEARDEDVGDGHCRRLRYLRVYIRRPARGWGVSLWQVDVFGVVTN